MEFLPFKQHKSQNSSEIYYKYTYLSLKYRGAGLEQGNYDSLQNTASSVLSKAASRNDETWSTSSASDAHTAVNIKSPS